MFDIPYDSFRKEIPKMEEVMIRLRKRNSHNKKVLTERFSLKSWESLPSDKKINHTYYSCMGCQNEPCLKMAIGLFPTKKIGCIKPKKPHPEHAEPNCSAENLTLAKKKELKGNTNRILSEANRRLGKHFQG